MIIFILKKGVFTKKRKRKKKSLLVGYFFKKVFAPKIFYFLVLSLFYLKKCRNLVETYRNLIKWKKKKLAFRNKKKRYFVF